MQLDIMTFGALFVMGAGGFVAGALVMRNNYKRLRDVEKMFEETKELIRDGKLKADQILLRIRTKLDI